MATPEETAVRERNVGIRCFISSGTDLAFSAIFKHRFSDFVVREVGLDGRVANLESISPEVVGGSAEPTTADTAAAGISGGAVSTEVPHDQVGGGNAKPDAAEAAALRWLDDKESLIELAKLVGYDVAGRFLEFVAQHENAGDGKHAKDCIVLEPDDDKSHRTKVVRAAFRRVRVQIESAVSILHTD